MSKNLVEQIISGIIGTIAGGLILAWLQQPLAPAPVQFNQPAIMMVQSLHQVAQALV